MENAEEIFQRLDEFSKHRPKTIPKELDDYLCYVARTGDPVYQWSLIKCLFKEKLLSVITDFYETSPGIDIPQYPNVDPFNYNVMKSSLVERIEGFASAPFTVQRICELLTTPRKNYNRIDKFMRAVEKNILVVSTREPGPQRHSESESGEHIDSIVNGSENSEYSVDVEMEDISNWKESTYQNPEKAPQASSSDMAMNVDSTPIVEKNEELEASERTNEPATGIEVPPVVLQDEQTRESSDNQNAIECTVKVSEPQEIELQPTAFLVDSIDSKSPEEQETDPLAIEESVNGDNNAHKEPVIVIQREEETMPSPVFNVISEQVEKSMLENTEMQVISDNTENISSEMLSEISSPSGQLSNPETSEDTVKPELILNVSQVDEKVPASGDGVIAIGLKESERDIHSDDVIVKNVKEDECLSEPTTQESSIESIADVIDVSSNLQTNVKIIDGVEPESHKEVLEAAHSADDIATSQKSEERENPLLTHKTEDSAE